MRVAVLKGGRSLERTRLAALRRSRAGGADAAGTRGARDRRRSGAGRTSCSTAEPDAAFIALHGRDGEDGTVQELLEAIGLPYTGSGPAACMRCTDKVLAKHLMRRGRHTHAGLPRLQGERDQGARRRRRAARRSSARSAFRWWSSRPARALRSA